MKILNNNEVVNISGGKTFDEIIMLGTKFGAGAGLLIGGGIGLGLGGLPGLLMGTVYCGIYGPIAGALVIFPYALIFGES